MTTSNGGPAFPTEYFYDQDTKDERMPSMGMTLRDYFAAKAMQGSLGNDDDVNNPEMFATWCYEMADAMMKARKA